MFAPNTILVCVFGPVKSLSGVVPTALVRSMEVIGILPLIYTL